MRLWANTLIINVPKFHQRFKVKFKRFNVKLLKFIIIMVYFNAFLDRIFHSLCIFMYLCRFCIIINFRPIKAIHEQLIQFLLFSYNRSSDGYRYSRSVFLRNVISSDGDHMKPICINIFTATIFCVIKIVLYWEKTLYFL